MQTAALPVNEDERLADLASYALLDTPFETVFDEIAALAARICNVPYALISLVDHDRQWFKAMHGVNGERQAGRNVSFCAHTILGNDVFEVPDARQDRRFADNPYVLGPMQVRLYAGAPLKSEDGNNLGALCVLSDQAKALTEDQKASLQHLSQIIGALFAGRRREIQLAGVGMVVDKIQDGIIIANAQTFQVIYANPSALAAYGTEPDTIGPVYHRLPEVLGISEDARAMARLDMMGSGQVVSWMIEQQRGSNTQEIRLQHLRMGERPGNLIAAVSHDITERKRLEQDKEALQSDLQREHDRLNAAHALLNRELEVARTTQRRFLPDPRMIGPLELNWYFEAASFIGGDIFDYFALDARYTIFYIADVSGHGVASALLSFSLQRHVAMLRRQAGARLEMSDGDVGNAARNMLEELNEWMLGMESSDHYATMFLGIIDAQTGYVGLAQAGHPQAIICSPNSDVVTVGTGSVPLGIMEKPEYDADVLHLQPGSRLFLYSDGITEASTLDGKEFGIERLIGHLACQSQSLADITCELPKVLQAWRGSAENHDDDVTLLAIQYAG